MTLNPRLKNHRKLAKSIKSPDKIHTTSSFALVGSLMLDSTVLYLAQVKPSTTLRLQLCYRLDL